MHTQRRIAAICLLLLAAPSCAQRSRRAEQVGPSPPSPERAPGEVATPAVAPAPEVPRLRRGATLLDTAVEDARGGAVGTVRDVLLEATTGEVVGVVVSLPLPAGARGDRVLEPSSLAWRAGEPTSPTLVLEDTLEALFRDRSELFDGRDVAAVAGQITAVEADPAGGGSAVVLKVRDDENLLHRVLVEPAHLVERYSALLEPGRSLKAEGVLTRDADGKLLVASTLTQDGAELALRDAAGAILWEALEQRFLSGRSLAGQSIATADGVAIRVSGWLLDWRLGAARYVCIQVDGVERALAWDELERDEASASWSVKRERAALSGLPAVPAELRVTGAL